MVYGGAHAPPGRVLAEAHRRRRLLRRDGPRRPRRHPARRRRLPAPRPTRGRRAPAHARAGPLHEGALRLGRLPRRPHRVRAGPRAAGKSSFRLSGLLGLAAAGLTSFSTLPLRAVAVVGALVSVVALGYGAWVIVEEMLFGTQVPGYPTIVVSIMFFSGVQLLSLGDHRGVPGARLRGGEAAPQLHRRRRDGPRPDPAAGGAVRLMGAASGPATRRVVLCADDFGMEPSVNEGILRLVEAGRLGAVTCMVEHARPGARAPRRSRALAGPDRRRAPPRPRHPLGARTRSRSRPAGRSASSTRPGHPGPGAAQLDRFEQAYGAPPALVDGHHHVHQLAPGPARAARGAARALRGAAALRAQRGPAPAARGGKAAVVAGLGARPLLRRLEAGRLPPQRRLRRRLRPLGPLRLPRARARVARRRGRRRRSSCATPASPARSRPPRPAGRSCATSSRTASLSDCAAAGVSLVRPAEASP